MLHDPRKKQRPAVANLPFRCAGYIKESIVDGPGLRFVLFVQGCPHRCAGCHNPETHDPNGGHADSTAHIWDLVCENPLLQGITFSGGEPFCQAGALSAIGRAAKEAGLDVMTYSGYTFEQLLDMAKEDSDIHDLLAVTDYLVDGPYVESKRDLNLTFRGSSNQRILQITCYPNTTDYQKPVWLKD